MSFWTPEMAEAASTSREVATMSEAITDEAVAAGAERLRMDGHSMLGCGSLASSEDTVRSILEAASPLLALGGIQMVDVAAEARDAYGEHANEIAGRELPDHEWRFELSFRGPGTTGKATMHHGATADDVQAYIAMMRAEGREVELARPMPTREQIAKSWFERGQKTTLVPRTWERAPEWMRRTPYEIADWVLGLLS